MSSDDIDSGHNHATTPNDEDPGANSLLGLFQPPSPRPTKDDHSVAASTSGLGSLFDAPTPKRISTVREISLEDENIPLLLRAKSVPSEYDSMKTLPVIEEHTRPWSDEKTSVTIKNGHRNKDSINAVRQAMVIPQWLNATAVACCQPSTYIGSFMFLLYHIVFCLTMGSAVIRPHRHDTPLLGLMTKQAACGVIFGCANYWFTLSDIPALYPTVDLFSAPFLAQIAVAVDEALYQDHVSDDSVFLATFSFLACLAILLSSAFIFTASVFVSCRCRQCHEGAERSHFHA
jgi:hypothetical protein